MPVFIAKGTKFLLNGRSFEIKNEVEKHVYEAEDLGFSGVIEKFKRENLLELLENGNLVFSGQGRNIVGGNGNQWILEDFHMLPDDVKENAEFKLEAIKPLLSLQTKSIKSYVEARVATLKNEGNKKISVASLYRWLKDYKESDGSIFSLVNNYSECGVKGSRMRKEVDIIIEQVIEEFSKKKEHIDVLTVHEIIMTRIDEANQLDCNKSHPLTFPSESTIRRRMRSLDTSKQLHNKKGSGFNRLKQVNYHERPQYPLQRVEADHTKLDFFVVNEKDRMPIGRPTITTLLDIFSGNSLGIYIGFEPASYVSVMHALSHAIFPKSYLKNKYPSINNKWDAYGIPETLVVDNGKEFHSKHIKDACLQLGINLYHCPVKTPWYKGAIERHFRTINTQLLHQTPGTTFSNIVEKGDYDPQKNAIISLSRLIEIVQKWLVDYYAQSYHKGPNGVPAKIWSNYFHMNLEPSVPESKLEWNILLMKVGKASIQRTGIRSQYLFYQSSILSTLYDRIMIRGLKNEIRFKYDPTDLSKIYVYDEENQKYHEVLCTDQKYSKNLNEYAHRMIIKSLKAAEKEVDKLSLAKAKAELMKMVEEEKGTTLSERKRNKRMNSDGTNKEFSEENIPKKEEKQPTEEPKPVPLEKKSEKVVSISEEFDYTEWGVYHAK
jgi:putative transposase